MGPILYNKGDYWIIFLILDLKGGDASHSAGISLSLLSAESRKSQERKDILMKHTHISRLLSVLLTLCMLLSIMPVAAFADVETITITHDLNGGTPGPKLPEGGKEVCPKGTNAYVGVFPDMAIPPEGMTADGYELNGQHLYRSTYMTLNEDITIKYMWRPAVPEVDKVEGVITGLKAGNTMKNLSVTVPKDAHYTAKVRGLDIETHDAYQPVGPDDVFIGGREYRLYVTFALKDDYIAAPTVLYSIHANNGNCVISEDKKTVEGFTFLIANAEGQVRLEVSSNLGRRGPKFPRNGTGFVDKGTVLDLPVTTDPDYVTAPEHQELDYYLINGVRHNAGSSYTCNEDAFIDLMWKPISDKPSDTVTATYDPNGGTPAIDFVSTQKFPKGETWTVVPPAETCIVPPEGKEFDAVEIEGETYSEGEEYIFFQDVTIKYLWKDKASSDTVTLTYDANGGTKGPGFAETEHFQVNDTITFLAPPSDAVTPPEGKEFDGYLIENKVYHTGDQYTVTHDVTVKLQWKDKTPEIVIATFDPNGGTKGSEFIETLEVGVGSVWEVDYFGEEFVKAPEGMEFDAMEINGVRYEVGKDYTFTTDATIKHLWKSKAPETVTVTYDINGGTKGPEFAETEQLPVNGTLIFRSPSSDVVTPPEGKEFDSYLIENKVYHAGDQYTLTHDITIKYQWKDISVVPETVTVTYVPNGGTKGPHSMESEVLEKGFVWEVEYLGEDFVEAPEGKEFDALLLNGVRYEVGKEYTFNEDTTMTFLWKSKPSETVTITYDLNGGTPGIYFKESITVDKGYVLTVYAPTEEFATAPEGKEFDALEIGGVRYEVGKEYTFNEDTAIKILWKSKAPVPSDEYSIVVINGKANYKTAGEGAIVILKADDRSDENLVFDHWKVIKGQVSIRNNQFLMPCEDVIVKAMYRADKPDPDHKPDHKPDHSDKHEQDSHDITVRWTDGGKVITEDGEGSIQSYQFKPDKGCHVADVLLDGESVLDSVKDNRLTIYGANHINELKVIFAPDTKVNPSTGAYDTSSLMMAAVMTAAAAFFVSKKLR